MSIFSEEKGTLLLPESYLAVIENSVGTNMFRNFYSKIGGTHTDVLRDGDLSCAFYVSTILKIFGLIEEVHSEVDATLEDLERSGWTTIEEPTAGSILIWEAKQGVSGEWHRHIGFYIDDETAISNDDEGRTPVRHHWTYHDTRAVETIFWKDIASGC